MVKIYDIKDYRNNTRLELNSKASLARDAEILMFTGVRYERLCDNNTTMETTSHFFRMPRCTSICRTTMGLNLKTM